MNHRIVIAALLIAFLASTVEAQNRKYRRRGVILGGLAGAAIGAAIGDKGNNETAGALIGAAAGAMAGGTIGNQKDQRLEHYQQYHSPYASAPRSYRQPAYPYRGYHSDQNYYKPHYYGDSVHGYQSPTLAAPSVLITPEIAPAPVPQRNENRAITTEDVVSMVNAGLSDAIILQQIQLRGIATNPSVPEIIKLHQMGVSEAVIAEMQRDLGNNVQELPAPNGFPIEAN
ncbi:MAG: glycine zipper domain-containing protein [Rubripirellula sp.]